MVGRSARGRIKHNSVSFKFSQTLEETTKLIFLLKKIHQTTVTLIENTICNTIGIKNQPELFVPHRTSATDLQSHLSSLELRVARETRRRLSLEDEVRRLRDENRRLQDENHAATQHIKRFTEWFMIYYH